MYSTLRIRILFVSNESNHTVRNGKKEELEGEKQQGSKDKRVGKRREMERKKRLGPKDIRNRKKRVGRGEATGSQG